MRDLKYWIWLSRAGGIGAIKAFKLINHLGDVEKVFFAGESDYRQVGGVKSSDISALMNKSLDEADAILSDCEEIDCRALTPHDDEYPERLKNIYDPPIILYVRGALPKIDHEPVVGIVGSRNCTKYGLSATETISYNLVRCGVTVTTGLAKGIDSAAARGALRAKRAGHIVGVIGSGHGIVYPPENTTLFDEVLSSGAIISEYPPYTPIAKTHFPARNRLISGISLGVAIIEAPKRSGALITASRALEQGRDVFTLPGNIDAKSCEGSNLLLRDGAIAFLSADDILSEYVDLFPNKIKVSSQKNLQHEELDKACDKPILQPSACKNKADTKKKEIDNITCVEYIDVEKIIDVLDGDERIVVQTILAECMHIDEIILKSKLEASRVLTAITLLEIKGNIFASGGKMYSITDNKAARP